MGWHFPPIGEPLPRDGIRSEVSGQTGSVASIPLQYPPQYDFGNPSAFSAMKFRIICGLTGAMRGM
jgi:hypothetical protein